VAARFEDRVAIVTGGASGIGEATVRRLVAEGARAVIADVDRERGESVAAETGATFEAVDVGDEAALGSLIERTARRLGRIDLLVSNAFASTVGPLEQTTGPGWERTIQVTLTAVFTGLRAVAPVMRSGGGGAVVNVASISGMAGDRGLAAYNAAKAGVINLTRTAALELAGAGIRVNAVCPGVIDTPALQRAFARRPEGRDVVSRAVPLRRLGRPEEIASAILFLASDDASYVTGATLVVDGGLTAGTGIPELFPEN
jgi:meso-butanediol dehydrogenase/(S,S)-butanediol dehydrogenase/diacetyl reductase